MIKTEIHEITIEIKNYVLEKFGKWFSWNNAPKALMYIVSECSEAHEAWRDNDIKKFGEELADIIIRTLDTSYWAGIDIEKEIRKKMDYNWKREKRHGRINV